MNATKRRTKHDFEFSDTNKDGKLTLAEYVAELLPGTFHGNETVAEVEASPAWKETENDWVLNSKVLHEPRRIGVKVMLPTRKCIKSHGPAEHRLCQADW